MTDDEGRTLLSLVIRLLEVSVIHKYFVLLRRSIGLMLEYRAAIFIWMFSNVMPLVMLAVWFALAEDGPIAGYSQNDFVSYYLLLTLGRELTNAWVIWELEYEIRHGDLSIKLLHPINPIHEYISSHLADKALRFVVLVPLALITWWLFPTIHYDVTPVTLIAFMVALVAAWILRFMSQYCIGLLAFWVSASLTLNEIWYAGMMMLGGVVAPLDLFPAQVKAIAQYLPFRFMLSFPVEIVSGRMTPNELWIGLATMMFWLVFIVVLYRWLWSRGIRQFSAFGA